jgi:hypothetical protein
MGVEVKVTYPDIEENARRVDELSGRQQEAEWTQRQRKFPDPYHAIGLSGEAHRKRSAVLSEA